MDVHPSTVLASDRIELADDVRIGPLCVIGGEGFQVAEADGKRTVVPHQGGVRICEGVELHSFVAVDLGLEKDDWTTIGAYTKVDNHVHIAHNVVIGERCTITACAEISGSVTVGDDVWLSPNCTVTNGIRIGTGAQIGIGAVVLRDVPAGAIIVGSHRQIGYRCLCRSRLTLEGDSTVCSNCGRIWNLGEDGIHQ